MYLKQYLSLAAMMMLAVGFESPAHAYLGPGVGLGAIGVTLGVIATFVLAFLGLLWYPLKRMLKGIRTKGPKEPKP
ncbi:hypothetical protein [Sphingorhabdus sp.]|jgi:hypothetical protein|uniref:hypothetical protein n=1 Tax=Sphingorhabdus sp. TaxID=1902408 RepID=UPI0037830900